MELYRKGYTNKAIATILKRTADAVSHRIKILLTNKNTKQHG